MSLISFHPLLLLLFYSSIVPSQAFTLIGRSVGAASIPSSSAHGSQSRQKRRPTLLFYTTQQEDEETLLSDIKSMRVKELKAELEVAGVDISDVFEKEELVSRLVSYRKNNPPSSSPPSSKSESSNDRYPSPSPTSTSASISRVPMGFHSLTTDAVPSRNSDVFLRPAPGKYPSININLPNHSRPLTLLVDTACSGIVLRPNIVQQYNLPSYAAGVTMQAAGGTTTGASMAQLISPSLDDGTKLENMLVAGQDIGALPNALDGIIGLSFLNQFQTVSFDFEHGELVLEKSKSKTSRDSAAAALMGMEVMAESPLKLCRIGVWTVDMTLDGRGPVKVLLDTGAASTFLNWKGVKDLNMDRDHPLISRNRDALGVMGADNMALALSHRFVLKRRVNFTSGNSSGMGAFGPLGVDITDDGALNVDIGDLPVLETLKSDNVGGILGSDILMRCDVLELDLSKSPSVKLLKRR